MKNAYAIGDATNVMMKSCETIGAIVQSLSSGEQNNNEMLIRSYKDMLLNEIENIQQLTIGLTMMVTEITASHVDGDGGGSVFVKGDLNDDLGDKTDDEIVAVEEKEEE